MWTYGLFDFDPVRDGDEEAWATALAEAGWRSWAAGSGQWIELHGRRVRRWSLRREVDDPRSAAPAARPAEPG